MKKHRMLADGDWLEAAAGEWLESINPFTAKPWALIPRGRKADVDRAVTAAKKAFYGKDWRGLTASARGALLRRLADLLAIEADRLAEIESTDNGKLLSEMRAQLHYAPKWFHYFAGLADKIEGFEAGADDYLVKPFSLAELDVRLKALVRRARLPETPRVLSVGDLRFDLDLKIAGREDEIIEMLRARSLIERAMVSTMEIRSLERLATLEPSLERGWTLPRVDRDWNSKRWAATGLLLSSCVALSALIVSMVLPSLTTNGKAREVSALTSADLPSVQAQIAQSLSIKALPSNLTPDLAHAAKDVPSSNLDNCFAALLDTTPQACVFGDPTATRTAVLVGDSHADQWIQALDIELSPDDLAYLDLKG